MTGQDIKAKVLAEIERLWGHYFNDEISTEALQALDKIKDFINSLPEEPASEKLEEEMRRYFETMQVQEHENIFEFTFQRIAKHFYEFGRKEEPVSEDLEEAANRYAKSRQTNDTHVAADISAFKAGAQWQKENTIEQAAQWLAVHAPEYSEYDPIEDDYNFRFTDMITDFKKAMED